MSPRGFETGDIPGFNRRFLNSESGFSLIGSGGIGGKARGLLFAREILEREFQGDTALPVSVPTLTVIGSDVFDAFIQRNCLAGFARSEESDDRIARAFQESDLPVEILGDLRAIVEEVKLPLAVRSSSRLEDALFRPFAGVFETKMTPNNQADPNLRFQRLVESIKFVFASTFFRSARSYIRATRETLENEKMSVVIQEVVGLRHNDRFYPQLSGVGRSFNFYPPGRSRARGRSGRPCPWSGKDHRGRRNQLQLLPGPAQEPPTLRLDPRLDPPEPVHVLGGQHGAASRLRSRGRGGVPRASRAGGRGVRRVAQVCRLDLHAGVGPDHPGYGQPRAAGPRLRPPSLPRGLPPQPRGRTASGCLLQGSGYGGGDRVRLHPSRRRKREGSAWAPSGQADGRDRDRGGGPPRGDVGTPGASEFELRSGERHRRRHPRHRVCPARIPSKPGTPRRSRRNSSGSTRP